ncbi:MAG: nitroreductase family protein [Candidatus Hadarchaeum sp.]|uniref:nitroreductase family protein n=1 Tax=Candidatus Hadarchaeum sp. TaxID=2883567 RepID=UPI003D0C4152
MEAIEAIRLRRSIRSYERRPVPRDKIEKILEAARLAPSAKNVQPWYFVVVTDDEKREKIAKSGRFAGFIKEAPVVIVGCGDTKASPKWHVVDVSIAMQNMVIAATAEGLGTCWVGSFDELLVKDILKIPEHYKVVALLALGYPRKKFDLTAKLLHFTRRKKHLDQIAGFEEFQG